MTHRVVIEVASKRAFVSAIDWPGWSRGGRTLDAATDVFLVAGPRYADVVRRAGLSLAPPSSADDLEVVERLPGDASTEFGVPGAAAAIEEDPLIGDHFVRFVALLEAAWAALDDSARAASGVELTRGPRGGGRDLPKILDHVREAERAYLAKLGSRAPSDPGGLHTAFIDTLRRRAAGEPLPDPARTRVRWSPRYAVRRAAWHVLDHAWEIEDRMP
jgi:hypothetical protein